MKDLGSQILYMNDLGSQIIYMIIPMNEGSATCTLTSGVRVGHAAAYSLRYWAALLAALERWQSHRQATLANVQ